MGDKDDNDKDGSSNPCVRRNCKVALYMDGMHFSESLYYGC